MQDVHVDSLELAALDLNGLVVLDALLATLSVTAAAQRLRLSQSATSHALARLRASFGDPLLVRGAGGLVLTARAEALAGPLREALAGLRTAVKGPRPFDPATARRLFTIATPDYTELVMLPALTRAIGLAAPGIDLRLRMYDHTMADQLARGDFDVAIGVVLPENDRPGVRTRRLFDERFVCIVRKGHPALGKRWTLERFLELDHALIAPSGRPGGAVDDALAKRGLSRRVALLVPHFLAAPFVIAQTDLVLTLPERVAMTFAKTLPLELLPPPFPVPGFAMILLWHDRTHHDSAHVWLRERIVEVAGMLGPRSAAHAAGARAGAKVGSPRSASPGARRGLQRSPSR
jgi:DNA-binding transcriptional LysR family regulator